jgi:hypothetical protein
MDRADFLKKVGDQYAQAGYAVVANPAPPDLPASLVGLGINLIARKGRETVAVQIKARDELYDLTQSPVAERVEAIPGWSLDTVVLPANGDESPEGAESDPEQIHALVAEAEVGLKSGAVRSAFLVAWAASEAAMREAARRGGLAIDREPPGVLLRSLYSNGLVTREEYDRGEQYSRVRNALAHGYEPQAFGPADVRFLMAFSQRLLSPEAVGTGP